MKQAFENVTNNIFAFLLIVENSACHPVHLGIMLPEQTLDFYSFNHVSVYRRFITIPFRRFKC